MKTVLLLLFSVALMADMKVPYPYPDFDNDLMAKEIINGTYVAAISMKIKNSQTGDERYVHVPSSRIEEKAIQNDQSTIKEPDIDTSMSLEDRDKLLEKSILPKYEKTTDKTPEIISKAMCPQEVELVSILTSKGETFIYKKDNERVFMQVSGGSLYRWDGSQKTRVFEIPNSMNIYGVYRGKSGTYYLAEQDKDTMYINIRIFDLFGVSDPINTSPFILHAESGLWVFEDETTSTPYAVYAHAFDDYRLLDLYSGNYSNIPTNTKSIFFGKLFWKMVDRTILDGGYVISGYFLNVSDGILNIEKVNRTNKKYATSKNRFDYITENAPIKYNLRNGVSTPLKQEPLVVNIGGDTYIGRIMHYDPTRKETIGYGAEWYATLAYSPDYVKVIDTGVEIGEDFLGNTESHAYFAGANNTIYVVEIKKWGYKIPRVEYAELFAREGMIDNIYWRSHDKPNIGD